MKVVILCGGKGPRLREETKFRPKPMVPIGNRLILSAQLRCHFETGSLDLSNYNSNHTKVI